MILLPPSQLEPLSAAFLNSSTTSYLEGATTLAAILVTHNVLTRIRFVPAASRFLDHQPQVLVVKGITQRGQLRRCGLTEADLHGLLRERGILDMAQARLVVMEQRGSITVVREPAQELEGLIAPFQPPRAARE